MTRVPAHTVADTQEKSQEIAARFEKRMGRLMNTHGTVTDKAWQAELDLPPAPVPPEH